MKLNIANLANGLQKTVDIDDEIRVRAFYDKRISAEVPGDSVADEFKGYVFRITGGNDKQGFPMKQGVLVPGRVRLLLGKGHSCYRQRRTGERKRKSVRGCIVNSDMSVLSLVIVKQGEAEIPGLTDSSVPKRLGPKRASKIRKLFNLSKEDDVRKFVIRREVQPKNADKKPYTKAPKIQRLVTPRTLQHKRHLKAIKKTRVIKSQDAAKEYAVMLAKHQKEMREKKDEMRRRRRSSNIPIALRTMLIRSVLLPIASYGGEIFGMSQARDWQKTVEHYLFKCSKWADQRQSILGEYISQPNLIVPGSTCSKLLGTLLGGELKFNYAGILKNASTPAVKSVLFTAQFLTATSTTRAITFKELIVAPASWTQSRNGMETLVGCDGIG
ncbi:hypothetical protein BB561_006367 [Smittium simulii]|uniref:40S ribosomal protein S6 n=1 Tax=Smittium simulii TaxID=133385 RepID=A0A2T9Y4W1_9FUNG|nr:hypothetical protein BB561_006367 [Smittium simulii]